MIILGDFLILGDLVRNDPFVVHKVKITLWMPIFVSHGVSNCSKEQVLPNLKSCIINLFFHHNNSLFFVLIFPSLLKERRWRDNSTITFHRFHEHNNLKELSFNVSHRYFNMTSDRLNEYLYILMHLRGDVVTNNGSKCLFIIPSTETWIFMDCF